MSHFPRLVQAAILLKRPLSARKAPLPAEALLMAVHDHMTDRIGPIRVLQRRADYVLFATDALNGSISFKNEPLDPAGLSNALSAPKHRLSGADFRPALAEQRAHILIEIEHGSTPGMGIDHPLLSELGMAETQAGFDLRLEALKHAANVGMLMTIELGPLALHWTQSDQLFAPDEALDLLRSDFDLPLLVQPWFFSEGATCEGRQMIGVGGAGTPLLLPKFVSYAPHHQSPGDSFAELLAFVHQCRESGTIPEHGSTFPGKDGTPIRVSHRDPDRTSDRPYILLERPMAPAPTQSHATRDAAAARRSAWPAAGAKPAPWQAMMQKLKDEGSHLVLYAMLCAAVVLASQFDLFGSDPGLGAGQVSAQVERF